MTHRQAAWAAILLFLFADGCTVGTRVQPMRATASVEPTDSLALESSVVDFCFDGEELVLLEASGERLIALDPDFAYSETIPLTERLVAPKGIAADRFYFYVYDDRGLFRMTKEQLVLRSWLGNVRVTGLASFSTGEMLVSDADHDAVWYKTVFGESRKFLGLPDVKKPGPILALRDGRFCVLSGGNELVWFNRAGIVDKRMNLGQTYDRLCADTTDRLFLALSTEPVVRVVSVKEQAVVELSGVSGIVAMRARGDEVVVLDGKGKLYFYRMP